MFQYHEAYLPGLQRYVFKPKKVFHRVATYTFEEGMYVINHIKQKNLHGVEVEGITDPQSTRIRMIANGQTTCVECGLKGNHFYIERHKKDLASKYSLNLYALQEDGSEVMMTWDHIIPKSLGGSNLLSNAQCMCQKCNAAKGNHLSLTELIEIGGRKNAHLMYNLPQFQNQKGQGLSRTLKEVREMNAKWKNTGAVPGGEFQHTRVIPKFKFESLKELENV
jgi:5-methylcytosine-specific restriction endonuclease McrA